MTKNISDFESAYKEIFFSDKDLALFKAFSEGLSNETGALLTKDLDIDNGDYLYLLMLGVLGFKYGWDHYPKEMTGRIQGIHRYEQVKNGSSTPWLANQIGVLEKEGIPVMMTGNTALRYAFVPDVPRLMTGYDLAVRSSDYDRAAELLRDEIKASDKSDFRNRTINDLTMINLHKGVHDKRLFDEEEFWETSESFGFQGHSVKVPSLENQLISYLAVPYGNWLVREKNIDRDYRFAGILQMLQNKDIDVERLISVAKKACVNCQVRLQASVMLSFADNLSGLVSNALAGDDEYFVYLQKLMKYNEHQSALNEYHLMNTCFRSKEERCSFAGYFADTRDIHSAEDFRKYWKRRKQIRKGPKE